MHDSMWRTIVELLTAVGVSFQPGLSDTEISGVEARFGFAFPPDLRAFLQTALPCSDGFPNWRGESESSLRDRLNQPREGVLFDVEYNAFWLEEWGPQPSLPQDGLRVAGTLIAAAPKLIPVYRHRMLPATPHLPGNPVFSVHQTDVIYYGVDLRDYFIHEFLSRKDVGFWPIPDDVRRIPFWDLGRFQVVRWSGPGGGCAFDDRRGELP